MISPKFPPTVDMIELISKKSPDGRIPARAPNAFIIYRKVYVETAREHGYYLPMTIVSSMASQSWESADETVKAEYRRIAKEALRVRNEMCCESGRRKKTNKIKVLSYQKNLTSEKTLLELTEFIEKKLKELNVRMFNYLHFRELKLIGSGGYANVYSVKFYGKQYAVKSLRNTLRLEHKEAMSFIHELKILREVSHPNIIKFYGVYKDPHTHNFMLILQLANGGTLRNYLESKWKDGKFEIPWIDLISFAIEITCGLRFLHEKKICHRDLIRRDEKSDIYSLGVVFWELTSGTPPFSDSPNHAIIIKISQGKRETIIPGTPIDYAKLYMRCWDSEPEKRPTLEEILTELKSGYDEFAKKKF
ncbi:kinase-like domain-containing protein [Gigaspora rosea]|uniref:Kinase-like domain-containing protein n=1 Tax=Gigaspora rosea TaxID=44941 RepID=A0A397UZS5_9GLOM|nr:kinase-like domain-containing protein [Gigaspora rosea]